MTDSQLRDIYTRSLTKPAGCPSPEALEALVTRAGAEESRLATLDHVMSCVACQQDFELLRAIHAAEQVNTQARPRRSVTPWLAAAVVLIAAGAITVTELQRPNPTRGSSATSDIALVGALNGSLVWRAIPGAVRYDVEIVDATGATIFHANTSDTTAALPTTLPTGSLSWWVRATLRDGSARRSAILPIR
jgi:hypothetical protein